MSAEHFEQRHVALDVAADVGERVVEGVADAGLRREVHHVGGAMEREEGA